MPDEQRKKLKREMERREIKRVSEEEIFEKGLEMGRAMAAQLNQTTIDSIAQRNNVRIILADTLTTELPTSHQDILEAYFYAPDKLSVTDNVQNFGDTIIYSAPLIENGQIKAVWFINIPRKKIVLAL